MIIAVGGSEENNVGIAGIDRRLDEDHRGLVRNRANLDIGGTCERGDALLLGLHRFGVVLQEGIGPRDRQGVVSRWKGREYEQGKAGVVKLSEAKSVSYDLFVTVTGIHKHEDLQIDTEAWRVTEVD